VLSIIEVSSSFNAELNIEASNTKSDLPFLYFETLLVILDNFNLLTPKHGSMYHRQSLLAHRLLATSASRPASLTPDPISVL
jgi:hypothetical protein